MNEDRNLIKNYETFFEEVWDFIPNNIVNDDVWYKHEEKFQELTFGLYHFYKSTQIVLPDGQKISLISTKIFARMIEVFVKNFSELLVK